MSKGYTATIIRPDLTEEERQRRIAEAKKALVSFAINTGMGAKRGAQK
jgi:hypothetical protein